MSHVTSNLPTTRYRYGVGQSTKSATNRSSSSRSSLNGGGTDDGYSFHIRSAAPPPLQKETVHACPLCNSDYKDPRVLPCTHTYCFKCIRDQLVKNSGITCPKCHYQICPFDESQLRDLPPNLILSQKWRISTRPAQSVPTPKKPVTYLSVSSTPLNQSSTSLTKIAQQQDRRRSSKSETNPNEVSSNIASAPGITSIAKVFKQSSEGKNNENQSSYSSSISSTQPTVSNLIKIYSEAKASKSSETDNIAKTDKHDEVTNTFEQTIDQNQQQKRAPSSTNVKQLSEAYEQVFEEIIWDNLVHPTTPAAPPCPEQLQSAIENHHHPPELPERSISVAPSDHNSNIDNLRDIFVAIRQHSPEGSSPSQRISNIHQQLNSLVSTPLRLHNENNDTDLQINRTLDSVNIRQQRTCQTSNTDSVRSDVSNSTSRPSPISPIINNSEQKFNDTSTNQQQDDKMSHHTVSVTSSLRHSVERFPPPPSLSTIQNLEIVDSTNNDIVKQSSPSGMSYQSSTHEQRITPKPKLIKTEHFNLDVNVPLTAHRKNSFRIDSDSSTLINYLPSTSIERDTPYTRSLGNNLSPTSLSLLSSAVISRVDTLLSDQKCLEHEIQEQIRRLNYDYEDVRRQINRKESSIHNEVKNIAARLDDDITEHYCRKQKIYENLAADTNTVRTELELLKSSTNNNNNNNNSNNDNKQQLWKNLEQIESDIRNIRQAVEQQKELHNALTFAEGRRTLGIDTIGKITYNENESYHQRYRKSLTPPISSSSYSMEQTTMNLTPTKYIKIDHLSTLEPEAIGITENHKKILLGICNKLFILNQYGDPLKTIQLSPSIRGIAVSKKYQTRNIAYISHDEIVSMIDIDSGQTIDSVKETDSSGESGTFLPLGIDTDSIYGHVYVCDYRNSCVIKFDNRLEFITQWRIYNHSDQYNEARPKLISVSAQRLYMIVEHSCRPYYSQGIAYTFSLHICDANSGNIIKIIDAELLATQRFRWPCSVQAIDDEKCYVLDTMTSGKYFNGHWQKHWSRVLEIGQNNENVAKELFQLDSEAAAMTITKQIILIAANDEIIFLDLDFLRRQQQQKSSGRNYP